MATKKTTSSPGTTRSRTKKTVAENTGTNENPISTGGNGAAAVAPAREKTTSTGTPNFHHAADVQEQIRKRAYELFQRRGGQHGFDVEDWLKAESEFKRTA